MKKFNYLFFCFVLFFCFKCNVFCEVVDGYNVDCKGNVVPTIVNKKGNFPNNSNNDCTFSFDSGSNSISSNKIKRPLPSCDKETESSSTQIKRYIYLIVDNSGSMDSDKKPQKVRKIFKTIGEQLKPDEKIVLTYFKKPDNKYKSNFNYNDFKKEKKLEEYADEILDENALKKGTNTNFVSSINKVKEYIDNIKGNPNTVPIVIFITDGYPTKDSNGTLGYTSSARYFYTAAKAFNNLGKKLNNSKKNTKFVTVGLGLDKSSSKAIKYILNPNPVTKKELDDLSPKNYQFIEDYKFNKLINNTPIKAENLSREFIFSVASNPDVFMTGYSKISKDRTTFTFKNVGIPTDEDLGGDKETIEKNGFVIGPIKKGYKIDYVKVAGKKVTSYEKIEFDGSNGVTKYFIKLGGNMLKKIRNKDIEVKLKSNDAVAHYKNINSNNKKIDLNGLVTKYYSVKKYSDVKDIDVNEIQKWIKIDDSSNNNKGPETIYVTEYTHNGISEEKTLNLGTGYVKKYNVTTKQYEMKSVSLYVNYLIDTSVSFNGGTLKNNPLTYAGGGFKFQDITLQAKSKWYYSGYAAEGVPAVSYKIEGIPYNINYNNVFSDRDGTNQKFKNAKELWVKIDEEVDKFIRNNSNKFMLKFDTVDSNDPNNLNNVVKVDQTFSYSKSLPTETDSDTYYTVAYNYKVKQACGRDEKFEYVDKECSDGYKLVNSFANEDGAYITGDDRYYFIPFGYKKEDAKVNVTLGVSGKQYTTTCTVKVNSSGNPCPDSGDSEPKSVEEQVSYRSIDVSNPFPRANEQYYSIPINWRNWYCNGVGTSNKCVENKNNINRLNRSYANIYYSGDYDSDKLTSIAKDTLNSSNNYYSSWENIDVETGKSKALDDNFIKQQFSNSAPSYCPLGSFDKKCDIYK